ncbi:MAG: tripartite tricarboxylate transporter substrate-binding protein [Rhodobacterales bacterium]|jgi:tripartite-type tricarboxylate transporter receptor subunit TctC|nr:tripartite tricarboxylate transporter substrate-binding protein [Pseudomonadota bacterium]MDA1285566.1 tripartite tricarboxylate transporter substrate-binding protein [Pseudomonadota bacterium]NQW15093.1 tripartite tricarboxylate transporter substrate binding protein [Rhodobacter sp.]
MRKFLTTVAAAAVLATGFSTPALAEYPEKPVQFIVPWPPGDLEDVMTRMIADEFQKMYGVPAAVVNKPGGGGGPFPGAIEVAQAPADGYTIGSFVIGVPVIGHKIGIPELAPAKFDPLGIFITYPFVLAAAGNAPYSTMAELAAYAKTHDVALGHFGAPLIPTKVTMAFAKKQGFEWGSEAAYDNLDCNTLASGDADVINTTLQLILPCLDSVKVLASITSERIPLTPNTPTVGEIDPALGMVLWNGLFVRKETPQDVRDKIIAAAKAAVLSDRAQELAKQTGGSFYWEDAAASAKHIEKDEAELAAVNALLE